MQVAGHVLWPRAAWLYHGATLWITLSFLVSGGLVSKLTLGREKLPFYGIILVSLMEHGINSMIKRKFPLNNHKTFMTIL